MSAGMVCVGASDIYVSSDDAKKGNPGVALAKELGFTLIESHWILLIVCSSISPGPKQCALSYAIYVHTQGPP